MSTFGGFTLATARISETPPVYPQNAGQGPVLPYISDDGLGLPVVSRADVQALLGQPEQVDRHPYHPDTDSGGHMDLAYPSLGLRFQVNAEDSGGKNPRVGWLQVSLPYAGRTPQGLYLGMPQDQAMVTIERLYKVSGKIPLSWGTSGRTTGLSVLAGNWGWRKTRGLTFTFRDQRLYRMDVQLKPTPLIPPGAVAEFLGMILVVGTMALFSAGVRATGVAQSPLWRNIGTLLGYGLLVAAVLGAALSITWLHDGDGYARLAGLVAGAGALGLGLGGLLLLTRGRNNGVPWLVKGLVLLCVALMVIAKLFSR